MPCGAWEIKRCNMYQHIPPTIPWNRARRHNWHRRQDNDIRARYIIVEKTDEQRDSSVVVTVVVLREWRTWHNCILLGHSLNCPRGRNPS